MNRQVKSRLSAVKDFLAGRSGEAKLDEASDESSQKGVDAEPSEVISEPSATQSSGKKRSNTARIFRLEPDVNLETTTEQNHREQFPQLTDAPSLAEPEPSENSKQPAPEDAPKPFLDQGAFDETVQSLRAGDSAAERAAAARALGLSGSQRGTPHLIAAMFDDAPEVRSAAEEALGLLGDPTVSSAPLNVTPIELDAEMSKLADTLHAPEAAAKSVDEDSSAASKETQTATTDEHPPAKTLPRDRSGRFLAASKAAAAAKSKAQDQTVSSENQDAPATASASAQVSSDSPAADESEIELTKVMAAEELDQDKRAGDAHFIGVDADSDAEREIEQLLLEEQAVRNAVEEIEQHVLETVAAFKESENEVNLSIERERQLSAAADERRRKEEDKRRRADEEVDSRRTQDRESVAAEQAARDKAESDAQRFAEEQMNLRLKAARLRLAAEDTARRRAELETARQEAAEAASQAEAARARDEAKSRHEAALKRLSSEEEVLQTSTNEVALQQANVKAASEKAELEIERLIQEQAAAEAAGRAEAERLRREADERNRQAEEDLRVQLEALRQVGDEVAARRAEVEAARAKAEAEAERLVEAHARMRAAEDARAEAETERLRLEMEINQQVETQFRLLEEMRRRGEEEQARVREEIRRHAEAEELRLAEIEAEKARAEQESKQRADKQQQVLNQIDSLRIADSEIRRRIEDAEVRRRAAEDAYRVVAEKVQRVETEAHARAKEEERILAKLEAERRTAAVEAQSRAEQEKRIKEEIEMFRRLEDQERPRFEEATLQLAAVEARLRERKERLKEEGDARSLTDANLSVGSEYEDTSGHLGDLINRPVGLTAAEPQGIGAETGEADSAHDRSAVEAEDQVDETFSSDDLALSAVTPAIANYLNSVDPYKRAAAVSELARSGAPDAFSQIVECFDDHSPHVRNAAARALRKLEPNRTVDLFNRALEEASEERRRSIGGAIAASGLATDAIDNLTSENREDTYNALSILFVMAKTGEVEPLYRALEEHQTDEIGKAVTKLLTLSGHSPSSGK